MRITKWIYGLLGIGINSNNLGLPPEPLPVAMIDRESIKEKLLELHNQYRAAKGLPPYARMSELDCAAQSHNDYMVKNNRLTHHQPNRSLGTRIKEQDYNWLLAGENIAKGQRTPEEVMDSWMNSSGHRSNILSRDFKDIGFGVTVAGDTWWWTVDFSKC